MQLGWLLGQPGWSGPGEGHSTARHVRGEKGIMMGSKEEEDVEVKEELERSKTFPFGRLAGWGLRGAGRGGARRGAVGKGAVAAAGRARLAGRLALALPPPYACLAALTGRRAAARLGLAAGDWWPPLGWSPLPLHPARPAPRPVRPARSLAAGSDQRASLSPCLHFH